MQYNHLLVSWIVEDNNKNKSSMKFSIREDANLSEIKLSNNTTAERSCLIPLAFE